MTPQETQELALIRAWVGKTKAAATASPSSLEPIAITGVAGFFPGCEDIAALWRALDADRSLLTPIPADRFDAAAFPTSADAERVPPTGWGGFIPDIASFDAELFGILPLEAEEMDPRQRLLLMSTWRTLEDASLEPPALRKSNTGVFVAGEGNEYAVLMSRAGFTPKMGFGQANSMLANRISYAFDFAGPSEAIDATCAGFAVALHRAVVALRAGLIDRAIVGAANVILLPDAFRFLAEAGQLTRRDTVKSFGRDGDGFARAEGVGTILLERREDVVAAGRRVYAEIRHTAVNFNGQGGVSMASPNTEAHAALIKTCYREAGIDPRDITYLEAQGMGSPVADIAEWTACNRALKELCAERGLAREPGYCRVSTLKPMLGHMHAAASLGALLKVIRSFQTGKIHPVLNFTGLNEYCDTTGGSCWIVTETEPWSTPAPSAGGGRSSRETIRLAAVHAYGSGGNNAHILLGEAQVNPRAASDSPGLPRRTFQLQRYWFRATRSTAPGQIDADRVLRFIRASLASESARFDPDASFAELALNSLSVAPFVARLEREFGVPLRQSDIFSHATPARLASYINAKLVAPRAPATAVASAASRSTGAEDIAIVGISLQTAGASTAGDFWRLLREGRSAIGEIPPERCPGAELPGRGAKGGFLSDVDTFDPLFFRISGKESAAMDPRHRKLLQAAWAAIEDSGHSPDEWKGGAHGVFIGIEESDYPYNEQSAITAVHGGTAPARIGYFLDLKGPVLAISTACSSSLVAVHYACRSILAGESDCALAGGCNIVCQPARTFQALARMGDMLSPDGTCYAFDRRANGMVLGEAVGLVVLKRLSHARRDGDPVYAVIKGTGINYDGRTNGLTAPNGARQRELYERVYRECGVEPTQISYVVAHGTGTVLGDPVECNALIDAFGPRPGQTPWCALTSPKTNIGHTQAAAGVVNLITAALALQHGEIPPSLNFAEGNGDIAFGTSPFYVNTSLRPWTDARRYAAVSSFGHTGTNAHALLAAAPQVDSVSSAANSRQLLVLSARSDAQLRQAARNLLECDATSLAAIAYTLQVGRVAMDERLGLSAGSLDEMRDKLRAFLDGRAAEGEVFRGSVRPRSGGTPTSDADERTIIEAGLARGDTDAVLRQWVTGGAIDWSRLHGGTTPGRVHLPTYPFEQERYWLNVPAAGPSPVAPNANATGAGAATSSADASMPVMTFAESWVEAPRLNSGAIAPRTVVCVLPGTDANPAWSEALRTVGAECEWIFVGRDSDVTEATFRGLRQRRSAIDAVVWLHPFGHRAAIQDPATVLPLLRTLAATELAPARLLLALPFADDLERCHQDAWTAFERSLTPVFPHMKTAVIGFALSESAAATPHDWAALLWSELTTVEFRSARYERRQRYARQVRPTAWRAEAGSRFKRGATYLITGGRGSLGLACAEHLVKTHGAHVILLGRSAADETTRRHMAALERTGGMIAYVQADVCDPMAVSAALTEPKKRLGPIVGVIHAAGVAGPGSVLQKSAEDFRRVLAPKVQGTVALDEALRDEPLEFIVYFSSSAGVLGDFGACDYAIGSRFQAAYAEHRNRRGELGECRGRTIVILWPVWRHGRMGGAEGDATRFYLETSGQRALETAEGLAVLEQLLVSAETQHLVLVGKPERLHRFLGLTVAKTEATPDQASIAAVTTADSDELAARIQEQLRDIVADQLATDRRKLRLELNLADFGYDSISLAEFAERLSTRFDVKITPAVFFGHSTLARLATYFVNEHRAAVERVCARPASGTAPDQAPSAGGAESSTVAPPPDESRGSVDLNHNEPIAVIGMSGRFPGARNIAEMWQILSDGRDAVAEIPPERFDWHEFYGDPSSDKRKSNGKWMGCLPGVAEFDPLFFDISPREAETMDPRQRHLLQESWNALEHAGYGPQQLASGKTGVFVGVEEGDYAFLAPEGELTSNHNAILASRLAYLLDFRGPVLAINTACSSGLVAAHQACVSLRNGECDVALVASASLQLTPAGHIAMGQSGMLSSDGKCRVFDQGANGLVPGEAVVVLVLKRLSRAEADGDPIHGVIRASGVNYDGKTNGITAPNGVAQTELLTSVYERAHLDPGTIEYVVAHGTGTKLGDPVEVNALDAAFRRATARRGHCALTSTKSNFGHTFAASGLVSAVSLLEAFRHEAIPPTLHCAQENNYITWEDSPFFVNKACRPWPQRAESPRRGAVSAFGMSGTNAHLVFEEFVDRRPSAAVEAPGYLLVLSAKSEETLRERVAALLRALEMPEVRSAGLTSVSHTLLNGRHHFAHRVAVFVRDWDDARRACGQFLAGETAGNLWRGCVPPDFAGQKAIRKHAATLPALSRTQSHDREAYAETLSALGDLYGQGYDLPWSELFGAPRPRRIALPTYPFARETYWVEKRVGAPSASVRPQLHPLLHANTSTLREQQFRATFTGDEFWLADHRVQGERVFPAVGYLEMARMALEQSTPPEERTGTIVLSHFVWHIPLRAGETPTAVQVDVADEHERVALTVTTRSDNGDAVTHASGRAAYVVKAEPPAVDLAELRHRLTEGRVDGASTYAAFAGAGVEYGPSFRGLQEVLLGRDEVLARVAVPDAIVGGAKAYALHPSLMDSAFQATIGLEHAESSTPRIPFALEQLTQFQGLPIAAWVWARPASGNLAAGKGRSYDLDFIDDSGRVLVEIRGLAMRPAAANAVVAPAMSFPRILAGTEFYVVDHGGVVPGVASLEWARAAGRLAMGRPVRTLRNVVWHQPLTATTASQEIQTELTVQANGATYRIAAGTTIHAQGSLGVDELGAPPANLPIEAIRARCSSALSAGECETRIDARLGPSMRSLTAFQHDGTEAFATLELPAPIRATAGEFILHPSMLNGALQACTVLARLESAAAAPATPFGVEEISIYRPIPAEAYAHVKKSGAATAGPNGSRLHRFDAVIAERSGEIVVVIRGYSAVAAPRTTEGLVFAVPEWREQPTADTSRSAGATPTILLTPATSGLHDALLAKWPQSRCVILAGGDPATVVDAQFRQIFETIQSRVRDRAELERPWLLVGDEADDAIVCASAAGLLRTARLEHARLAAKVVRCAPPLLAHPGAVAERLASEIGQRPDDVDVRLAADGRREVRALREATWEHPDAEASAATDEVIWITGGLGGVGRAFAEHYAGTRKARVFLTGRSSLDETKQALLRSLQANGATVRYLQGDIANVQEVAAMLRTILAEAGRLTGIIHAAGVIEDAYLVDKTTDAVGRVWRPKVGGARAIDEATRDVDLAFMAFCSSLTGSFGNAGQSDYAGANAFLDAFADERNRKVAAGERRGRTISIAWPLWRDGGMRMDAQSEILLQQRSGMTPMPTARGLAAFHRVCGGPAGHVLVLHGDTGSITAKLFRAEAKAADSAVALTKESGATAAASPDQVHAVLRRLIAEQQKIAPEKIELDVELPRYGFDSIRLTEFANRLNRALALDLMPTLFFEHTTVRSIARYLLEKHPAAFATTPAPRSTARIERPAARRPLRARGHAVQTAPPAQPSPLAPIAIVGMSGRFPGSPTIDEFWRHLEANRDLVTDVPADRWNWRELFGDPADEPGKTNVKSAGFMAGIDEFDPAFFGISPREAISLDPQFRLLLQTVWATIEDAGYRAGELSGTKTGVFVGVSTSDYKDAWLRQAAGAASDGPALVSHFVVANRISYLLDLHGPSEPIDTACSSSLIAIHRAIEAIRQGNCDQAIVGGVNVISAPDITIGASRAGMLSPDGRCKTFDRAADGYGRGEGVGALLLKPLDAALRAGDHIYALVRGSAENHGGRAQSPTAPNPAAQRDLLVSAYTRAGVDPRSVGYIEAHGTGTPLGDPIEIDGLRGAFETLYRNAGLPMGTQHCGLGSVKTNIGHLEAAAGIAGVIKVVMMLRHRKIPGNVHLRDPNPYLRLAETPFYLVRETRAWEPCLDEQRQPLPLRAGVSSFGIGGSNAHVILEEYPAAASRPDEPLSAQVMVLSARTAEQLNELAANLRDFLQARPNGARPTLREIACTLQLGREAREERLGFVVGSTEELISRLNGYLAGQHDDAGIHRGRARVAVDATLDTERSTLAEALVRGDYSSVLMQWVRGAEVDWSRLWSAARAQRVSLPTYPFARNRYWFGTPRTAKVTTNGNTHAAPPALPAGVEAKAVGPAAMATIPKETIETFLVQTLAKILYLEADAIERGSSFIDLGLDSVLAVEWIQSIKRKYGIKLPATKVYDYPTVSALTDYLAGALGAAKVASEPEPAVERPSLDEIFEQVRTHRLSVEEAEQMIEQLGLDGAADEKGARL